MSVVLETAPRPTDAPSAPVAPVAVVPQTLIRATYSVAAALFAAGVLGHFSRYLFGHDFVFGLVPLFEPDREGNVATWFQANLLLLDAGLAAILAARLRSAGVRFGRADLATVGLLVYVSMDEAAQIHERLRFSLGTGEAAQRFYYYTWLIPGVALLAIAALAVRAFLRRLPAATARAARVACLVYVGGAVAMELVGGLVALRTGPHNLLYALITSLEEGLEMAGMCLFATAMLVGLERLGTVMRVGTVPRRS